MAPKAKENPVKAAIWLPIETHEALKWEAKQKGLTVSSLARMILMEHTGVTISKKTQGKRVVTRQAFIQDGNGGYIPNPDAQKEE